MELINYLIVIIIFIAAYYLFKKMKKPIQKEPVLKPILSDTTRYKIQSNIDQFDKSILALIEDSYERLNGIEPHYHTNYKDLMYLQLHLDNGKLISDYGINDDTYKRLITEVDYFFMGRLLTPSPNDTEEFYLPKSLDNEMIGYH